MSRLAKRAGNFGDVRSACGDHSGWACARAGPGRSSSAVVSLPTIRSRRSISAPWSAPPSPAATRTTFSPTATKSFRRCRRPTRDAEDAALVRARGGELPDAPQDPRGRWAGGFTGGVGVADYWLGHAQDGDHWRDTHVRVRGPIVQSLEAAFYDNFAEAGGPVTPILDRVQAQADAERRLDAAVERADRRQQRAEKAVSACHRDGAPVRRCDVALFHHRRVHVVGPGGHTSQR